MLLWTDFCRASDCGAECDLLLAGTYTGDTGTISCNICPAGEFVARVCAYSARAGQQPITNASSRKLFPVMLDFADSAGQIVTSAA